MPPSDTFQTCFQTSGFQTCFQAFVSDTIQTHVQTYVFFQTFFQTSDFFQTHFRRTESEFPLNGACTCSAESIPFNGVMARSTESE